MDTSIKMNIRGCWVVEVPQPSYRFGAYVNFDSYPEEIIDMCYSDGLFDFGECDKEIATARRMTQEEFDTWSESMHILTYE